MLINAEKLFQGKWTPLHTLCVAAFKKDICDFRNPKAMKEKGMEILKSVRTYDFAYGY
jgi:hypothetical protein